MGHSLFQPNARHMDTENTFFSQASVTWILKGTLLLSAQRPSHGTLKTPFFSQASVAWILKGTLLISAQRPSHGTLKTLFLAKRPSHGFLKGHSFFQPKARHMKH
jgi:hypothetical protein